VFNNKRTKQFLHNFIELPNLETTEIDGKRHYVTPVGNLPSVTTVIGERLPKDGLVAWRERIGEEEANKVMNQAAHRGTAIHSICENYLMNLDYRKGVMPFDLDTFSRIKPHLDRNVGSIYGIEVPLWSAKLKTAGRTDLLAGWHGINSVIDFKTSKRVKTEDQIESYFIQATCYSMMAEQLTGLKFPQIVVIIAVDHEPTQVFVKRKDLYVNRVLEIFA
jgi:hypothetical protein